MNPTPIIVSGIKDVVITFEDGREMMVLPGYIDIGLADTMHDIIVGAAGALLFCIIEFIALVKRDKRMQKISESLMPRKTETEEELALGEMMNEVLDEFFDKAEFFSKK